MVLKFNGNTVDLKCRLSPTALLVKSFLEKSAEGELYSALQLAARINSHVDTVKDISRMLPKYVRKVQNKLWFGSLATIQELDKELKK